MLALGDVIVLPFGLGSVRFDTLGGFLGDLFLSSSGAALLTFLMLPPLFLWRFFFDDGEEYDKYMEKMKEDELQKKWDAHNKKWGTTTPVTAAALVHSPLPSSEVRLLDTSPVKTQVTILGDIATATTVLLTYHDVGMNHRWCFSRLIHGMNSAGMLGPMVAVVHVDAPGHQDGATTAIGPSMAGMSIETLAQQLHAVVQQLDLKRFLGLGIGAGANVLLRYASDHPSQVHGLALMNPTFLEPSRCESLSLGKVQLYSGVLNMREAAVWEMAKIHFSGRALACTALPRAFAKCYRQPLEWDNKKWFVAAYRSRDALDAARLKALKHVPIVCFSAWESAGVMFVPNRYPEEDTDALVNKLVLEAGHSNVSHIRVRGCGAQLAEERSEEILGAIQLFITGIGLELGK